MQNIQYLLKIIVPKLRKYVNFEILRQYIVPAITFKQDISNKPVKIFVMVFIAIKSIIE